MTARRGRAPPGRRPDGLRGIPGLSCKRPGRLTRTARSATDARKSATAGLPLAARKKGRCKAELENLPVMVAYEQASQALRALVEEVDRAVSAAAGVEFIANVRPDRHG